MRTAGIILAGGESTRMGRPKATLEWHGSTLVRRAAGIVGRAVHGPVVVVHAAGQQLAALPGGVELAVDARAARGPLEGFAAGLAQLGDRADAVFVCGVDAPLLHPALIELLLATLAERGDEIDAVLPVAHGFPHPLAAAYRTTAVAGHLHDLLDADSFSARELVARCRTLELGAAALLADPALAAADPQLDSLASLNDPDAYEAARRRPAPEVTLIGRGGVRAATLGAAGEGRGTVNGRAVSDPQEPLVAGDEVTFAMRQRFGA